LEQVTNGIAIRMAVLYWLAGNRTATGKSAASEIVSQEQSLS
jgi:hypothetical protein